MQEPKSPIILPIEMSVTMACRPVVSTRLQIAALCLLLAASFPTVVWYVKRAGDKSDEPLGLLALAMLIYFLISKRASLRWHPFNLLLGSLALLPLQLAGQNIPPMLIAGFLWLVLFASINVPGKAGIGALMLLSLPLMASLDFYAGYPMRWAASWMAHELLSLGGFDVERQGLVLLYKGNAVGVDPPCSGIRMLWAALFVAALVSIRSRLGMLKTLLLLSLSVVLVIVGNSLRATILFLPESGFLHWPFWTHEGVGLVIYGLLLGGIFAISSRLAVHSGSASLSIPHRVMGATLPIMAVLFLFLSHKKTLEEESENQAIDRIDIPSTWEGQVLHPMPLSEQEQSFLESFPGQIAKYRSAQAEIIFRLISKPTRLLHSSTDCFRASGFAIEAKPVFYDDNEYLWSCHLARLNGQSYRLKERIISAESGKSYQDVSSWYWAGFWKRDKGPWLAVTVLEVMEN